MNYSIADRLKLMMTPRQYQEFAVVRDGLKAQHKEQERLAKAILTDKRVLEDDISSTSGE